MKCAGRVASSAATNESFDDLVLVVTADDLLADAIDHVLRVSGNVVRRSARGGLEPAIAELRPALVILDTGDDAARRAAADAWRGCGRRATYRSSC